MELRPYDQQGSDVIFQKAPITFPAFDYYKEQAAMMADYINNIVLTPDNVKDVKKDLAEARKVTDELNRRRILIKKTILEDFNLFEEQVKELGSIITDAEGNLRAKVRDLEDQERKAKEEKIREIWDKRVPMYRIGDLLPDAFHRWLSPQHLNKSESMKKIESSMTEWLERTEKDIATLSGMDNQYLAEYLITLDMSEAISAVNHRKEVLETITESEPEEPTAVFVIKGNKEIKLTELLLRENNIEFIRR